MPRSNVNVEVVGIDSLVEYERNAKQHTWLQVQQIANSIQEFGFNDPIGVWHNDKGELEVVEGHGRLRAAKELGISEVPVIVLDHMTDEQRRAYAIVHNKITMDTGFDPEKLLEDMDELEFDFESLGFNAIELAEARSEEDSFVPFEGGYDDVDTVATAFVVTVRCHTQAEKEAVASIFGLGDDPKRVWMVGDIR